jgi:hypothetical protein
MDYHTLLHYVHILVVAPLFFYVGTQSVPDFVFTILFYLGIFVLIAHIYFAYNKIKNNKSTWVNLIHIFIIAPLLIYIGYNKRATERKYFEFLLMLGFAALGYHSYYLFY